MADRYGPIQVAPSGLLGFLNIKDRGKNPAQLLDEVQGGIDLGEWWLQTNREQISGLQLTVVGGSALGFRSWAGSGPLLVPQDQWWYVLNYSISCAGPVGAGDAIVSNPAFIYPIAVPQAYGFPGAVEGQSSLNGSYLRAVGPCWIPPGSEIGQWLGAINVAANISTGGSIAFARLPI